MEWFGVAVVVALIAVALISTSASILSSRISRALDDE